MNMRILIIEDELALAENLADYLGHEGFLTEVIHNGAEALAKLESASYEAIVLDWLLPGIEGIDILRTMRERGDLTPVLMLTAQSALQHRVKGISEGADDYVTKPFHNEEIAVRLRALIRRTSQGVSNSYYAQGIKYTLLNHKVSFQDKSEELSQKEADILTLLFQNRGKAVSRAELLKEVWGYEFDPKTNVVEVYIRMLRTKLIQISGMELIETIRGVGYQIPEVHDS